MCILQSKKTQLLDYLLFIVYLVLFAWLVTKSTFFTVSGLSKSQLVILFLLKVMAGIFCGWMGLYYASLDGISDTWSYHKNGIVEYNLLLTSPYDYLTNLFHNPYEDGLSNFFASSNSYWNDLKSNIFIKLLSIFDIFSFGNYYINIIFYSFITFFGSIAIYRVMADVFKDRKNTVLITTFFIPSFFYWATGIYKEGLIFMAISFIIYHIYFGSKEYRPSFARYTGVLLGFFILFVLRNFILLLIIPAIIGWLLANKWPKYSLACFAGVFLFFCLLFFDLRYIDSKLDFPQMVVNKQQTFIQIVGNSTIPIRELEPTAISFVKNIPQAIALSSLRPYPTDIRHFFSLVSAVETALIILLFLLSIFFRRKHVTQNKNLVYFCALFSILLLLSIGFSVNNLGAIVRYRSVVIPLLLTITVTYIDWNRLMKIFSNYTKNNRAEQSAAG